MSLATNLASTFGLRFVSRYGGTVLLFKILVGNSKSHKKFHHNMIDNSNSGRRVLLLVLVGYI